MRYTATALTPQEIASLLSHGDSSTDAALYISILALFLSVLIAMLNYLATERRRKDDIVRVALTDLTTDPVARARDEVSAVITGETPTEFPELRARYFELCWAYQRGDSASRVRHQMKLPNNLRWMVYDPHGYKDLLFHLAQMAVTIRQFHNSLDEGVWTDNSAQADDLDIWSVISEPVDADVISLGITDPSDPESYREYYANRRNNLRR